MWSATIGPEGTTVTQLAKEEGGGGPKAGAKRIRSWKNTKREKVVYTPIVRPIFDWSEVEEHFPQAAPEMDYSLLAQLLQKKANDVSPSLEKQSKVQGFSSKVITVIENMILTGEGEQLTLEEVRLVGSQKKGTGLHDSVTADIVTLFKDVPKESVVIELAFKVKNIIETAAASTDQPLTVQLNGKWFDMINYDGAIVRVFSSSTGDIIYGAIDELPREDFNVYTNALRMIRHTRWWDEHTESLKNVRSLVRIIKSMRGHVPGLAHLNVWYIELLCHCSLIPLNGAEPLSLLDGFRRLFELLAAGLFLPGSIGLPDPCEEGDDAIHENLLPVQCEELTSHAQRILVLLQFGAYREVLACDGCSPAKFSVPYSFGELTLDVSPPAYLTALNID